MDFKDNNYSWFRKSPSKRKKFSARQLESMNYQTGTTLGGTCHPPWDSADGMVRISSMGARCTEIEHLTIRLNLFEDVVKFHKPTTSKL